VPQTIQNRYRDLNLSFVANPVRKDISTLSDADAVKRSVVNLVLTKHYERPFHPEIGCNVTALLFENITAITALNIKRSIEDVIQNFEPRARIQSVAVDVSPDANGYSVSIQFYVLNVTDLQSVDFFLERLR
jgi:phage baseplate assembly protein W